MIFYENTHWFFMKFYDSFNEISRNFMTLIVSQKSKTRRRAKLTYNYKTINPHLLFMISLDITLILRL